MNYLNKAVIKKEHNLPQRGRAGGICYFLGHSYAHSQGKYTTHSCFSEGLYRLTLPTAIYVVPVSRQSGDLAPFIKS